MGSGTILMTAAPTAGFLLVMGAVHAATTLTDRWRPGKRGPIVVVDNRTFKSACRRIEVMADRGEYSAAYAGAVAIGHWLRGEVATGPARRKLRRARQVEYWELRREQLRERTALHDAR